MPKPPDAHFRAIWYVSMFHVVLLTLIAAAHEFGVISAEQTVRDLAIWSFAWFLSPELAAGGVKAGYDGTKTGFLFWTVTDRWPRVLIGLWMGLLIFWCLPNDMFGLPTFDLFIEWGFGRIVGAGMTAWLPVHYWRRGIKGPVDHAVFWLAERTGLDKLVRRIRGR